MISRRILRIKVLQTVYSFYQGGDSDVAKSEKELLYSIQKSYDLYFYLFLLGVEVCNYAESVINSKKQKFLATETDLLITNSLLNSRKTRLSLLRLTEKKFRGLPILNCPNVFLTH